MRVLSLRYLFIFTFSLLCNFSSSYRILVVFPMRGISHSILGNSCVDLLLEAGHQVTYILWGPASIKPHQNLTTIDISYPSKLDNRYNIQRHMNRDVNLNNIKEFSLIMSGLQQKVLENEQIQKLLNDSNEYFDLAILEWLYAEFIVGFAGVFGCPYIWFSTMEPQPLILNLIDEVTNPTYVTMNVFKHIPPLTFIQRIHSMWKLFAMELHRKLYIEPLDEKAFEISVAPLIAKRRNSVPSYSELRYNASLVLGNSHISVGSSIPLPQAYKAIGGYHIKKIREPLPMDLKNLMDKSTIGVIYFSMGSSLLSKDMPAEVREQILKVFSGLKQTVVWKIEIDLPNRPSNLHIVSWAPQQSVLDHPNCVLFITHGGILSSLEAVHFGVPLIGIPVFADQNKNIKTLAKTGMAKEVTLSYNMGDELKAAIEEILSNSSYAEAAKHQSFIYHHRPAPPEIELVHWVEHVIRTGGAKHLRSVSLTVTWYQRWYLDLAAVVIIVTTILVQAIKWLLIRKSIVIKDVRVKKYE